LLSLRGLAACPQFIQHHRQDDDRSLDDQLPIEGDVHQRESIVEDGNNQGADQRPENGPDSASETGATQDNGRDCIQLIADAQLALGTVQTTGTHDTPQPGEKAAYAIDEN